MQRSCLRTYLLSLKEILLTDLLNSSLLAFTVRYLYFAPKVNIVVYCQSCSAENLMRDPRKFPSDISPGKGVSPETTSDHVIQVK